jgi:glucose-6-phosphate isomerase
MMLEVHSDGELVGRSGSYRKVLDDMASVYFDADAYATSLRARGPRTVVYEVQEQSYSSGTGALIVGTSRVLPGLIGDEFAVTRGHLHAIPDRAELYLCLSGHGVMLLETVDGRSMAIELVAGQAVNVPGHWIHRSVNVGSEPFVTLFTYAADAGQDYSIIAEAGGMRQRIVSDGHGGWAAVPNTRHRGYSAGA